MKSIKSFIYGAVALTSLGLVSCQDDFDDPKMVAPVATNEANITIADFKTQFWSDEINYIWEDADGNQQIPAREDGSHYIISGRVCSSDESGNIFKALYIKDETAALPMSVNQYNLYTRYRVGQEVVIDVTGMYIGKYNGLQQLGFPSWYEKGNCWEASFMAPGFFEDHVELNGFPEPALVDTITIKDFSEIGSSSEELIKWQGQIVRFNDCTWASPGTTICDEYHSSGYTQQLNVKGGTINVRTSGYSKFWNQVLPEEGCDVVGILSYYGTQGWQLVLNDGEGIMNVGNPTLNKGIKDNPYTVPEAIAIQSEESPESGWVKGYIVGAVAAEVVEVSGNGDIDWTNEDLVLRNTLVIAPDPEVTEISRCLVIELPANSDFRTYGNLVDHPENYKKAIQVSGYFGPYMGTHGILNNHGTVDEFIIEGVDPSEGSGAAPEGDGSEDSPFNVTQVVGGTASGSEVWVTGYIVGWVDGMTLSSGATFNANATSQTNLLIALTSDVTDYTKCVPVQLPSGSVRTALNLQSNPGNYLKSVQLKGSIETYFGTTGLKTVTEYKLDGGNDNPAPSGDKKFTKASSVIGGKGYMLYVSAGAAYPVSDMTKNFGFLYVDAMSENGGVINAAEKYAFAFIATSGGYNIMDSNGRYLYMSGTYTSFQLADAVIAGDQTFVWSPELQSDGTFKIVNQGNGNWIQYSTNHSSYGSYSTQQDGGVLPYLYEMEGTPSFINGNPTPDPDPTPGGAGSKESPYSVAQVISGEATGTGWVKGYIVGWVDGMTLADGATFNADATSQTNLLIAASADETNVANCVPVQLPSGAVRTALNLQSNPGNYKQEVLLNGSFEKYFGVPGVKSVTEYELGSSGTPTPDPTPDPTPGDNSMDNPYTIAQVLSGEATGTGWASGYIVGWVEGMTYSSGATFNADATVQTNILLADSQDETDPTKCVPVQLPAGDVRTNFNLQVNPVKYKSLVVLNGSFENYFGVKGIKSVTECYELK